MSAAVRTAMGANTMKPKAFGRIVLARGIGRGPTELAAFDAALRDAGIANYNLLGLSSVIPPGSTIEHGRWVTPPEHWGQRLYVCSRRCAARSTVNT